MWPEAARSKDALSAGTGVRRSVITVQPFAHFLARLEERDTFLIVRNCRSGSRIAPVPGRTMLDREGPETAQLDPITTRQSSDDFVEYRINDVLYIPLVEMRVVLGDTLNE